MTTFLDALYSLVGMTEDDMNTPGHSIEYEVRTYTTPSLIDHDREEAPHPHGNHENPIP